MAAYKPVGVNEDSLFPPRVMEVLDERYGPGFYSIRGEGIDPTGATDSTVGLNAFFASLPEGSMVVGDKNDRFLISSSIGLNQMVTIFGGWFQSTSPTAYAFSIKASDVSIIDSTIVTDVPGTPNRRQGGINISTGNNILIHGNRIEGFNSGIWCEGSSSPYNVRVSSNYVLVRGTAHLTTESPWGESTGDGFAGYCSSSTIVGNNFECMEGTYARCGVNIESTFNYPNPDPGRYPEANVTVIGNTFEGKFRRGITFEGVRACTGSGNTISDSVWGSLAMVNSQSCVFSGNSIFWTAGPQDAIDDSSGEHWDPRNSFIRMQGSCQDCSVIDTHVRMNPGSVAENAVFLIPSNDKAPRNTTISGLYVKCDSATLYSVVFLTAESSSVPEWYRGRDVFLDKIRVYGSVSRGVSNFTYRGVRLSNSTFTAHSNGSSDYGYYDQAGGYLTSIINCEFLGVSNNDKGWTECIRMSNVRGALIEGNRFTGKTAIGNFGVSSAVVIGNRNGADAFAAFDWSASNQVGLNSGV